jgi:hypothetical protein
MAVAFASGYAFAKGRLIVIERKVELTPEEKEKELISRIKNDLSAKFEEDDEDE